MSIPFVLAIGTLHGRPGSCARARPRFCGYLLDPRSMIVDIRIDKWLWCVRAFKTRADAAEACQLGRVTLNGNEAKPGRDVRVGDTITVRDAAFTRTLKALSLPRSRVAAKEL